MAQDSATGVAIDGSVTPVMFSLEPQPSQSGDITLIKLATTSPNNSDLIGWRRGLLYQQITELMNIGTPRSDKT